MSTNDSPVPPLPEWSFASAVTGLVEVTDDLIAYIRPEAKFDSIDALVEQIGRDAAEAGRRLDEA